MTIRESRSQVEGKTDKRSVRAKIGGRVLRLTNLDKVMYPKAYFTKGHLIEYYTRIAPVLLPHLKDRPLTLKRYPDGVEGKFFYQKRCPESRPSWVKTASIRSDRQHRKISYCLANNLPSLVWAANLADLELHTSLACSRDPKRPTAMVFDLDPGPGVDIMDCAEVALWLRALLSQNNLKSFPKTSGSKGLQIYVPLNTQVTFDSTKHYARQVAERLRTDHPNEVVDQMSKSLRRGKVFIDWSQNDDHKTTVCVYSLRAKPSPTVSTPLQWREVEVAFKSKTPKRLSFEAPEVLERVKESGDLFEPVLTIKQKLPELD